MADIPFRLIVHAPPPGVTFRMQSGRQDLVPPSRESAAALEFDFALELRSPTPKEPLRFGGPLVQGRVGGRFLYLNSGTSAGQADSCWTRRAKISLEGIDRALTSAVQSAPGSRLVGGLVGTGRDGGPVCASTALAGGGWRLEQAPR